VRRRSKSTDGEGRDGVVRIADDPSKTLNKALSDSVFIVVGGNLGGGVAVSSTNGVVGAACC
jgi:hypothetical protein